MSWNVRKLVAERFVGAVLAGRYRLTSLLGTGGMGAVYRAEHTRLSRVHAIKLLLPQHAEDTSLVERFHREARGLSLLRHPNVVEVVDTGETEDGLPFIVMEFLQGEPLSATLKRECRLTWPTVKQIALQVCNALHAAHEAGIIHRDVKPANCFRVKDATAPNKIKLLDFGIAKLQLDQGGVLTGTGNAIGTLPYMSKEQVCGDPCTRQSDIWSAAVMFYQLLTGKLPFTGNLGQISLAIVQATPTPVSKVHPEANLPHSLDHVLAKALAKDKSERYATMIEFCASLVAVPDTLDEDITARVERVVAPGPEEVQTIRVRENIKNPSRPIRTKPLITVPAEPTSTSDEHGAGKDAAPSSESAPDNRGPENVDPLIATSTNQQFQSTGRSSSAVHTTAGVVSGSILEASALQQQDIPQITSVRLRHTTPAPEYSETGEVQTLEPRKQRLVSEAREQHEQHGLLQKPIVAVMAAAITVAIVLLYSCSSMLGRQEPIKHPDSMQMVSQATTSDSEKVRAQDPTPQSVAGVNVQSKDDPGVAAKNPPEKEKVDEAVDVGSTSSFAPPDPKPEQTPITNGPKPATSPPKKKPRTVPDEAPRPLVKTFRQRTHPEMQQLTKLLRTKCAKVFSAIDSYKIQVRVHRSGEVQWSHWVDKVGKLTYADTSVETCIKKEIQAFSVTPGTANDKSFQKTIELRKP